MADSSESEVDGRATIARLADEMVPALIERLTRSELGELEVREGGWRIRLRRPLANGAVEAIPHAGHAPARAGAHPTSHVPHAPAPEPPRGLVTSPAVGYFAPRNGVEVGSKVRSGDPIGHIDVLGVRHEVVSPVDGSVRALEVQPGQAVEYGQAIARVEAEA